MGKVHFPFICMVLMWALCTTYTFLCLLIRLKKVKHFTFVVLKMQHWHTSCTNKVAESQLRGVMNPLTVSVSVSVSRSTTRHGDLNTVHYCRWVLKRSSILLYLSNNYCRIEFVLLTLLSLTSGGFCFAVNWVVELLPWGGRQQNRKQSNT